MYSTVLFFEPSVTLRILRKVIDTRSPLTAGTQCFATSAPLPFNTRTEPTGSATRTGASKMPSSTILISLPKRIGCSDKSESVTNGRTKSWWSMCGGMQSPSEYLW